MSSDCLNCGHPIGYHHAGTDPEMHCSCKDCDCIGYSDNEMESPQTGPEKPGDA